MGETFKKFRDDPELRVALVKTGAIILLRGLGPEGSSPDGWGQPGSRRGPGEIIGISTQKLDLQT